MGLISCVLLSLFWSVTTEVSGDPHSVAMFLLTFLLAAVDCTSSVVFLPFMKHFPKEYVSALYIGEGLSGLVPSVVGLSQGFANNSISCIKEYPGHNELGINFSPSIYFAFLAGMMAVCGAAFVLIVTLPCTREQRRHQDAAEEITSSTSANSEGEGDTSEESRCEGTRTVARKMEESESNGTLTADENAEEKEKECLSSDDQSPLVTPASRRARMRRFHVAQCTKLQSKCPTLASLLSILWDNLSLLLCIAALNFLTNGALSAVSSYAFIPYGNLVYHLGVNLGILANPVACLFYTFVPFRHRALGAVLTALAWLLGIFVLVMAFLFPNPLLSGNSIGGAIMVSFLCLFLCETNLLYGRGLDASIIHTYTRTTLTQVAVNVAISLLVSYAKVGMVVQLHSYHGNQDAALLMGGVATQLGSLAGAVLFFFIVYFTDAFS